jgi:dihydroxy-acid dehydratase
MSDSHDGLNRTSRRLTQVRSQGASQAMLHATGLTRDDLDKAQVGIAAVHYDGNPCNMHLGGLATRVRASVQAADLVGMRFFTVGVSDGISMGTDGMSYSLRRGSSSRTSVETAMGAHFYDGLIALTRLRQEHAGGVHGDGPPEPSGADDLRRHIRPGARVNRDGDKVSLDVISAFQSYGEALAGHITEEERQDIVARACPGPGACGGMYTANTMAVRHRGPRAGAARLLGDGGRGRRPRRRSATRAGAGAAVVALLARRHLKPRGHSLPRRQLRGTRWPPSPPSAGSTNAVLHLLAMARTRPSVRPRARRLLRRIGARAPAAGGPAALRASYAMSGAASPLGGIPPRSSQTLLAEGLLRGRLR